jgi:PadR family transcriptional regulator PadR
VHAAGILLAWNFDLFVIALRKRIVLQPGRLVSRQLPIAFQYDHMRSFLWQNNMADKTEVWQGTLALMVLNTLETLGPLHGYGIARRIEQISGDLLVLNYGTLYPALLKLEQEGSIVSEWGVSDNNRKAKFYKITRSGRRHLQRETRNWEQTTAIVARFIKPSGGLA